MKKVLLIAAIAISCVACCKKAENKKCACSEEQKCEQKCEKCECKPECQKECEQKAPADTIQCAVEAVEDAAQAIQEKVAE